MGGRSLLGCATIRPAERSATARQLFGDDQRDVKIGGRPLASERHPKTLRATWAAADALADQVGRPFQHLQIEPAQDLEPFFISVQERSSFGSFGVVRPAPHVLAPRDRRRPIHQEGRTSLAAVLALLDREEQAWDKEKPRG